MPSERRPPEPWRSFLRELDRQLGEVTNLHCMGGFAVSHAYGMARSTVDIDVLGIVPYANLSNLIEAAGKGSLLHKRYKIYLEFVSIVTPPDDYATRVIPLYEGEWERLCLFALESHDLALTKLERNSERDRGDISHLAQAGFLDAETLRKRYRDEMRPYMTRERWHDQTLQMWIEAFFPEQ